MFYNNLWFNRIYRGLASLLFLLALTACSSIGGVVTQQNKEQSFAGPGTLFEASEFIDLNLCNTMIQFGLATAHKSTENTCSINSGFDGEMKGDTHNYPFEVQRNNFVSFVMGLSEQRCGAYKAFLLRDKAKVGTMLGTLTTLFAGTSAVLTHAKTASAYAAGASAFSGINAVYSQERFANLALEVVTSGINQRRTSLAKTIKENFTKNLVEYPVGMAVDDALRYHAACTAVTGLEEAKDSISRVNDPGVSKFNETLNRLGLKVKVESK